MKNILLSILAGVWTLLICFLGGLDFSQRSFELGAAALIVSIVVGAVFALLRVED